MRVTWLAEVLRGAGLKVVEQPGWRGRGREFSAVKGVVAHHTGSNRKGGNAPALKLVTDGRADLPGPLSQLVLARDGTFYVVADGRSNHAGPGSWQGVTNGNAELIGIEAENDGIGEPWPTVQLSAYAVGVAAILKHIKADAVMAVGHKEWATPKGRKIDPTFDMRGFRDTVQFFMGGSTARLVTPVTPATVPPTRAMLQKGDRGEDVKLLQRFLGFTGVNVDGDFGPMTDTAVREFQRSKGLVADGKVGPKTWSALGVK